MSILDDAAHLLEELKGTESAPAVSTAQVEALQPSEPLPAVPAAEVAAEPAPVESAPAAAEPVPDIVKEEIEKIVDTSFNPVRHSFAR